MGLVRYNRHLWIVTEETNGQNEFPEPPREDGKLGHVLLDIQRSQLRRSDVFLAHQTGERTCGRPRTCWTDYIAYLAWEHLVECERGMSGISRLVCCPRKPSLEKQEMMEGSEMFENNRLEIPGALTFSPAPQLLLIYCNRKLINMRSVGPPSCNTCMSGNK